MVNFLWQRVEEKIRHSSAKKKQKTTPPPKLLIKNAVLLYIRLFYYISSFIIILSYYFHIVNTIISSNPVKLCWHIASYHWRVKPKGNHPYIVFLSASVFFQVFLISGCLEKKCCMCLFSKLYFCDVTASTSSWESLNFIKRCSSLHCHFRQPYADYFSGCCGWCFHIGAGMLYYIFKIPLCIVAHLGRYWLLW